MKVIKRNGKSVSFNPRKIKNAIRKAGFVGDEDLNKIVDVINEQAERRESMTIEDIQDLVEFMLMKTGNEQVAREYIRYRKTRELIRQSEATNESILKLIDDKNEYLKTENSNKNHAVASTQRDYIAGEVSKDISMRLLLSKDIVDAHKKGAIHAHDLDYMLQHEFNCCLVDLENIFKSGTVINGTMIERPHSFATACNIATQIAAIIASNQYGGQTMSYSHLAPFVDVSRKRIRKELIDDLGDYIDVETLEKNVEKRVRDEVARGVQTIQYQILTLNSSNGQTPFITMFMYLGEAKNEQEKNDLAMIIEEVLKQRMRGVKNETGQWITPAFPKLIYVLEPSNITEDAPYWYLTELAAQCTSKRLVPDYISEKKMLEFKGACFPCMGCVDGDEIVTYKFRGQMYVEGFKRMWDRLSKIFEVKHQFSDNNPNLYIDVDGVDIFDTKQGFVKTLRVIRNVSNEWMCVRLTNGRVVTCTSDHPFETQRGTVLAKDLTTEDEMDINHSQVVGEQYYSYPGSLAWMYGVLLCDASLSSGVMGSFAKEGEDDLIESLCNSVKEHYPNSRSVVALVERGKQGNYKTVRITGPDFQRDLICAFEGVAKKDRHIPTALFSMNKEARMNFLAGMIDADGYICDQRKLTKVQIGSTNKELALQQAALMQSLGMPAFVYVNRYTSARPDAVAYRVECVPTEELIKALRCAKKRNHFGNIERTNSSVCISQKAKVSKIEVFEDKVDYSYDVTTESEHFEVSGIYSHNCRSFLSPWRSQLTVKNNEVLDIVNGENATVSQLWANLTNDSEGTIEPTDIFVDHKIVSGKIKRHKVKSITKKGNTVTAELESDLIFYGRFNQGVATINLPFAALESVREVTGSSDFVPQDIQSQKDVLIETFWKKLERYAELCHKVLQTRHARLLNTGVEISPLHWMHGGLARLPKHGNFNELLVGGYSTASLGYAGLYEAVYALIGQTHTSGEGKKFALQILQKLNNYCDKWKKREDIGYSLYGSPIESTTYKFAQANQREFGTIEEVTDHGYVTNSYHVNVRECIDPFTKLDLESEFQALSQGGCISYIETANLQNNIPAVLDVIKHIYDHIMYAELNCKSDYCQVCGSSDEIQIVEKDGKHIWRCRHCGNEDQTKMNVARRTCGYIGSNFWNEGRTQEIAERYVHLGETETLKL